VGTKVCEDHIVFVHEDGNGMCLRNATNNPLDYNPSNHKGLQCFIIRFRMKKSRRILWAGRVARVEETEMRAGFWWEKVKENPL